MTTVDEEVREGSLPAVPEAPESIAQMRAGARKSITRTAPAAFAAVTQRVRNAGEVASRIGPLLDKPGTLAHSQPPTFRQAHARHHECASHFGAPILRWLRLLWGYLHLAVIKPALNLAEWVTESPLRFFLSAVLVTVIWLWS